MRSAVRDLPTSTQEQLGERGRVKMSIPEKAAFFFVFIRKGEREMRQRSETEREKFGKETTLVLM